MDIGKLFIFTGFIFVALGLAFSLGLGRLPGDISIHKVTLRFMFRLLVQLSSALF